MDDAYSSHGYHSTAVLLPDGRVLSAGGESTVDRLWDYEIYKPPYLTTGKTQPVITSAPASMQYYSANPVEYTVNFTLPSPRTIQRVVLMRPCSTTHHSDFDQRLVRLNVTTQGAGFVKVHAPVNSARAPRGWYMLFLLTDENIPSTKGEFVFLQ